MAKLEIEDGEWVLLCKDGSFVRQPRLQQLASGGWRILIEFTAGDAEGHIEQAATMAKQQFDETMKGETYVGTKAIRYEKASLLPE